MFWKNKYSELYTIEFGYNKKLGTLIFEIRCHDNDDKQNCEHERAIVQEFINSILKSKDCIITGKFCKEDFDTINQKNIIREIENIDTNLKSKRKVKNLDFYLKDISINNDMFEIAPWNFSNITIWEKELFNEVNINSKRVSKYNEIGVLCEISIVEMDCLKIYISDKISSYKDEIFKKLELMGYVFKKRLF